MKKYVLTKETITVNGSVLHRIKSLKSFSNVKKGDLGGWIEKESNLSQDGNAWVYEGARVYEDARVYGNAEVYGNAKVYGVADVYGDALVYGYAEVYGVAKVYGGAKVYDDAEVYGNVKVYGGALVYGYALLYGNADVLGDAEITSNLDYMVFKNSWSSGRYFTYTLSNKKWKVGCFYGTGKQLIKKAYQDSELKGKCYEATVKYAETIAKLVRSGKKK